MLSPQWLDQLRSRITLSALIGRTTRLQKAGREFKACCPFHSEKSPSFTVNDEKGFYHCFGCGAHGDAIRWMTDHQGLAFMDAVKELAAEAGMDVPAADPGASKETKKRDSLYDVMAATQEWFVANLNSPEGSPARAYLATRGFDAHTIQRFGFGYAPEGRQALKSALPQFPEAMLIEAGLRIAVDDREPYDRFRGRLMLPIQDARGRVIAFGGRILTGAKTDAPKYLNSPDTPLFDKGRTLYNLHRAAPAARQSGRLILVEGYMDVIALAAAGIEECVAPLGTALTESQLELLWRQVETPILCFDGDAAGQRAAMRAVDRALPLLRPAHSLKIVTLPTGMDPDDIIRRAKKEGFELQLEEAFTLLDFLWLQEKVARPIGSPEEKAGLKDRLEKHIEKISHPEIKQLYRRDLFDEFFRFAYPRRDPVAARKEAEADSHPGVARWRKTATLHFSDFNERMRKRLGAAIAKGFMYWPDQLAYYAEDLCQVRDIDLRIDAMLDETGRSLDYNQSNFLVAFAERGLNPPEPPEFDFLRFPFAWPQFEKEQALPSLKRALSLYMVVPTVQAALNAAQQHYEQVFDEESENEKIRLARRLQQLWLDIRRFESSYAVAA